MDGYGMVRNMIATNKGNLSRVGQRRSHKFESFDTSLYEPSFPTLNPYATQPLSLAYKVQFQEQQQAINKKHRLKNLVAGMVSLILTSMLMTVFFWNFY